MDRLSAMNLYCHIIETGQLSLAADQLNLSKGTVSKQLAKLEAHLGGVLIFNNVHDLCLYYPYVKNNEGKNG